MIRAFSLTLALLPTSLVAQVNIFDKSAITANSYMVAADGTVHGYTDTEPGGSFTVTDYMVVMGSTQYSTNMPTCNYNQSCGYAWFDSNKTYINGGQGDANGSFGAITSPPNAAFLRETMFSGSVSTGMWVSGASVPSTYVPYGSAQITASASAPASVLRPTAGSVLYFEGSSITAGQGLTCGGGAANHNSFGCNYAGLIGTSLWASPAGPLSVYNDGIDGQTSAGDLAQYTGGGNVQAAHELSPSVSQNTAPAFYFLDLTEVTNDVIQQIPTAASISNLQALANKARADGYIVILMTSPILGGGPVPSLAQATQNLAVADAARRHIIYSDIFIDLSEVIPDQTDTTVMYQDGTHPTALGHAALAAHILAALNAGGDVSVNYTGGYHNRPQVFGGGVTIGSAGGGMSNTAVQPQTSALSVNGTISFQDGTLQHTAWRGVLNGGDYAEAVDLSEPAQNYAPGDLIIADSKSSGRFRKSDEPYSRLVSGVYATKPGALGRRQSLDESSVSEIPMAMVGIVPTKVTTDNGSIQVGDLLVSSSIPGVAMKGTDMSKMLGAVVGKALSNLKSGTGVIEVLVTLQ